MTLKTGEQLGVYNVVGPLGVGGMGEVYRATDTKLGREVAIKVLPEAMAHHQDRIARFEREAKVLASLNHPMIAAIYGFDEADGKRFLVLELVEGPTLADRLANGRLPVEESLDIAQQIAEALEVAHEKGVVHRDLKPANVKVTLDGQVKVLDFGLAKALAEEDSSVDPGASPTITKDFTMPGVILGTAAYMSPEQARGRPVDKRSDIWSFGCVLYECLTGESVFLGETVTDSIGAILHKQPEWAKLPVDTPPQVQYLLMRCLAKDRKQRLRDIGDALIELRDPAVELGTENATRSVGHGWSAYAGWLVAAALVLLSSMLYLRGAPRDTDSHLNSPAHLHVATWDDHPFTLAGLPWNHSLAISPDGAWIAYVGWGEPQEQLYYRRIGEHDWRAVPASDGARSPFFSPNGEKLGFFTNNSLKVATLTTNERPEQIIRTIAVAGGAYWEDDNTIVYLGSPTSSLTRVDIRTRKEKDVFTNTGGLAAAQLLPGGERALVAFLPDITKSRSWEIGVADFTSNQLKPLGLNGTSPHYDQTSRRLVFVNDGKILSAPFDLQRAELTETAELLEEPVIERRVAELSVSHDGRIFYAAGAGSRERRLVSIDPSQPQNQLLQLAEGNIEGHVRLHPNERTLAVTVSDDDGSPDIRLFQLDQGRWGHWIAASRMPRVFPVWNRDHNSLTYMSTTEIRSMEIGGTALNDPLFRGVGNGADFPISWHPDEDVLLYTDENVETNFDVGLFDKETGETSNFVKTEFVETGAMFSPDGNWVAYQSNARGRFEIFIKPYPPQKGQPIFVGVGSEPLWSRDEDTLRLFHRSGQKMMSVEFQPDQKPVISETVELFRGQFATSGVRANYDADKEGRFYMVELAEGETPERLNIITDWNAPYLAR